MSGPLDLLTSCALPVLIIGLYFWAIVGGHPYVRTLGRRIREHHRRRRGLCPTCGYDLRGSVGTVCPECGAAHPNAPAPPAPLPSPTSSSGGPAQPGHSA